MAQPSFFSFLTTQNAHALDWWCSLSYVMSLNLNASISLFLAFLTMHNEHCRQQPRTCKGNSPNLVQFDTEKNHPLLLRIHPCQVGETKILIDPCMRRYNYGYIFVQLGSDWIRALQVHFDTWVLFALLMKLYMSGVRIGSWPSFEWIGSIGVTPMIAWYASEPCMVPTPDVHLDGQQQHIPKGREPGEKKGRSFTQETCKKNNTQKEG